MRYYNIPIFIPELACPHQCVFCDQQKISGHSNIPEPKDIPDIVDKYLASFTAKTRNVNIAFFGGSFTGIERQLQEAYLKEAQKYVHNGKIQGIRLSTRPDYINNDIVDMLKHYSVSCIELGAQSMHPEVLKHAGRGHTVEQIEDAAKTIKNSGIELGLQMMLGLPADTKERSMLTARKITEAGAANTRIYPTLVIEGTALAQQFKNDTYKPLTLDEAIDWAKDVFLYFIEHHVNVLRTGLHPSEEFEAGKSLLAGPYHPGFKELMLTAIWKDKFRNIQHKTNSLEIEVSPNQVNNAIGHKKVNRNLLLKQWKQVKISANNTLTNYQFHVINC
ncbi:radical SAM protein [Bacteroidales bacterium]|nr:radical SAM protein [Bacteroidales bacterium]